MHTAPRHKLRNPTLVETRGTSDEQFCVLVGSMKNYAICTLAPAGYIVSWNAGAEGMKDYRTADIIGRHFSCLYPPEHRKRRSKRQLPAAATAGRVEAEGWRVRLGRFHQPEADGSDAPPERAAGHDGTAARRCGLRAEQPH
jgi:hypothetical protein